MDTEKNELDLAPYLQKCFVTESNMLGWTRKVLDLDQVVAVLIAVANDSYELGKKAK